ncbi:MAG: hypothetical protein ABSG75_15150 [Syntrophales bacterium]|jgi:hypothetical protein
MKYKYVWGRYIIDLLVSELRYLIDVSGEWNFSLVKFADFNPASWKYKKRPYVCQDEKPFHNYCLTCIAGIVYYRFHSRYFSRDRL